MDKIQEFLDSLEGKSDLDPVEVARKMSELHVEEVTTRDAKIQELENEKVSLAETLTTKDQEIVGWKAKNFDLTMQLPGTPVNQSGEQVNESTVDGGTITIDDLFTQKG